MKTYSLKLSVLASALLLVGCGSGSTTDTAISDIAPTTNSLSKISGTVPGTLIEAFCEDGSYYSVNSTDNHSDEHPFEIEIPNNLGCSLVMTTNENNETTRVITQIGMVTSDANGTLFTASGDIDLGHISLAMDPSDITDANGDHVSDEILYINVDGTLIEIELENPLDDDHDGLVNVYEDDDDDAISNYYDDDDDGDGKIDSDSGEYYEDDYDMEDNYHDLDGDGIENDEDVDDDNDGYPDDEDSDDDNDGVDDYLDTDDDNDGYDDDVEDDSSNNSAQIVLPTSYSVNVGRLLGSQCAQCHGTNGVSSNEWDSIAGETNLLDEIFDDEPIMNAQAHGYTPEEILLIGNWLKTLPSND